MLTGGEDGKGSPFGAQVHVARSHGPGLQPPGVDRVESLTAQFTRTKSNTSPREGALVLCPAAAGEVERVALGAEETASVDVTTFTLTTVA